jgi:non-canonical purine NTP pyrophosphatase (RdgB/HAM1 family)
MKDLVFITGNQHKADFLKRWIGFPIEHQSVDLEELQSLDLREVVEHKARQAYDLVKRPVLVEDISLTFDAMGRLPGTYIKWFVEELGMDGLADLAQRLANQGATASILYAYYDGTDMHVFPGEMHGTIIAEQRGTGGFGFAAIFMPDGYDLTMAELGEAAHGAKQISHRYIALQKFKAFYDAA